MTTEGLVFNEAEHSYRLNGRRLPSVTQVLDFYNDFSMVREDVMELARWRGSLVHRITELYDKDDLIEENVEEWAVPYLAAWKRFRADTQFKIRDIEVPRASDAYGYAGTIDRLGAIGRHDWVIDIKGGAVPPTAGLQTAAYRRLIPGNYVDHIRRATVQLKKDGTYALLEWKREDDWAIFRRMLEIHTWFQLEDKRGS